MENATVVRVSNLVEKTNFRFRYVLLKIDGQYNRQLEVKATQNASEFATKLVPNKEVTLVYPGESAPKEGTVLFITPETKQNGDRFFPEIRCYKIYVNNGK